jgi:hypothetical protein
VKTLAAVPARDGRVGLPQLPKKVVHEQERTHAVPRPVTVRMAALREKAIAIPQPIGGQASKVTGLAAYTSNIAVFRNESARFIDIYV